MATLRKKTERNALAGALALARQVTHFPASKLWLDFDPAADVLYISLQRPQKVTETVETEDGILLRYRNRELVGITVLGASKR
ncbi:MAG TPA: DUF2283 domain-containing protein [Gemmataceae bacterium]|jgi:uncharacterized protein YuzE|nr:DUF2283 domain-containing protein [Gemmataceae bacterium]